MSPVEYVIVAADHGVVRGSLLPGERAGVARLPAAVTFEGRVVDVAGAPIAGAAVAIEGLGRVDPGLGVARSGADGTFRFTLAAPNARALEVCAPGYRCRRVGALRGDDRRSVDLGSVPLEPSASSFTGDAAIEVRALGAGLRVEAVFPGSRAAESTLRPGDLLVAIDGHPPEVGRLQGAVGTVLVATVERDGRRVRVALPRERVLRAAPGL